MTILKLRWEASDQERFSPGTFDSNIGRSYEVTPGVFGTLTAVEISDDGHSAELIVETDLAFPLSPTVEPGDLIVRRVPDPFSQADNFPRVTLPQPGAAD